MKVQLTTYKVSLITLILVASMINLTFGQTSSRKWEDGPLTWADFSNVSNSLNGNSTSELHYTVSYNTSKLRKGDSVIFAYETNNLLMSELSWVVSDLKNDQLLRYNQVIFNLAELYRRELQQSLYSVSSVYMANEAARLKHTYYTQKIRQFQLESNYGIRDEVVEEWDADVHRQLEGNPYSPIPAFEYRNFGYGLNIGMATGVLTNTLGQTFKSPLGLIFGFEFSFKKAILNLNGTLSWNATKQEYINEGLIWDKEMDTKYALIDLSLGYLVLETSKSKIAPFAGLGIMEFSASSQEEEFKEHLLINYNLLYGINYEYKFRKKIRLTTSEFIGGGLKEMVEHNLRFRLYGMSANFQNLQGSSINLAVGYSIFGRLLRLK